MDILFQFLLQLPLPYLHKALHGTVLVQELPTELPMVLTGIFLAQVMILNFRPITYLLGGGDYNFLSKGRYIGKK